MVRYIARRTVMAAFVALLVSVLVFVTMNVLPGDPADAILGTNATPEAYAAIRQSLNLDDPLPVRYGRWIGGVLRGDLGTSIANRYPVSDLLKERLPPTIELGLLATAIALLIALPLGIYSAMRPGSWLDVTATFVTVAIAATPVFLFGILLILLFGVRLGWLPISGFVPLREDPLANLRHMILPAIALGSHSSVALLRQTRSAMTEVLRQDYIRTAEAKGLRARRVVLRHAFRNALIPVLTVFGFQVGIIFGGAVLTEQIFNIPGMGQLLVTHITRYRDYPVVQSITLLLAVAVLVINLAIDLLYAVIDPRIRYGE